MAGNEFTVKIALGLIISTSGGVLFSSKSICDNMITSYSHSNINSLVPEKNKGNLNDSQNIDSKNFMPVETVIENKSIENSD